MQSDEPIYYLCGPMSGYPRFNFPAFQEAAKALREKHFIRVISPAEIDTPEDYAFAMESKDGNMARAHKSWGQFLGRDIALIADKCQGIVMLPGWLGSKGARLEVALGLLLGLKFKLYFGPDDVLDVPTCHVHSLLTHGLLCGIIQQARRAA